MFGFKALYRFIYILFNQLVLLLHKHTTVHIFAFDPIHDVPSGIGLTELTEYRKTRVAQEGATIHNYFLLHLVVWASLVLDTLYQYLSHSMSFSENPYIWTHRMYPPTFWAKGDMLVLAVSSGILLYGLTFLLQSWLNDRFCMYVMADSNGDSILLVDGAPWNRENAAKILKFRSKIRSLTPTMVALSVIIGGLFFFWSFWNSTVNDFEHHFKMWVLLPVFTYYCVFAAVLVMFHFFVVIQYVLYKQSYLLALQLDLLRDLRTVNKKPKSLPRLYRRFHHLQALFARQCVEIAGYNIFWRLPLTVLFAVEIETFCYLLYSCLFDQLPIDAFIYFFFFLIEMGAFFFFVIFRASMVDHHNDRAYERNVHLAVLFQLAGDLSIDNRLRVNIEKLATNRNFSRCCFRLANGYRVDSTAFQMALYIVSTFFLMICRNNRRVAEM